MDRNGFEWISLQFEDRVGFRFVWVDFIGLSWIQDLRRFGSICIGSTESLYLLLIWADFTRFQRFGRLKWIRIDLGIFEFGLVNLIGVVRFFMNSSCLGGSGQISIDSIGFV